MTFVSYLLATGEITQIGDDPGAIPGQGSIEVERDALAGVSWLTHYVSGGVLVEYSAPQKAAKADPIRWAEVRARRDALLAATDWRVTRASEVGELAPEPWRVYRQALRDITEQPDPTAITWPTPPG